MYILTYVCYIQWPKFSKKKNISTSLAINTVLKNFKYQKKFYLQNLCQVAMSFEALN